MTKSTWKSAASDDLKNSELSISQIASKYGRSPSSIKRLMRSEKIYRTRKRRGGLKPFAKMDALSPDHVRLGLYLIRSRGNEKKTSFGKALGVSATRLGQMEAGRHDFTLREMQNIADLLGKAIFELQLDPKVERDSGSTLH
ncbi:XRE family transcriptional regulator [Sinorhizobium medicae]|uniref:helix-turn-helix domain-containing protein n=1 Tax=Sinorhizobium medicae TaxID=110321 RepID=UPI000FDBEC1F|nr:helix-turn-helix transcriptional regulator [Sinorhizobium medicae]RVJ45869.1 XRE family transcriptional regulator [Sinorhizobium medicae]